MDKCDTAVGMHVGWLGTSGACQQRALGWGRGRRPWGSLCRASSVGLFPYSSIPAGNRGQPQVDGFSAANQGIATLQVPEILKPSLKTSAKAFNVLITRSRAGGAFSIALSHLTQLTQKGGRRVMMASLWPVH